MSHGHHHHTQDAGHTHGITPGAAHPLAGTAALNTSNEAPKADDKASKAAEREAARAEKAAQREAERKQKEADREAKKAEKQAERDAKAAEREAERAEKQAARAAESEEKKAERAKQREADKESKKAEREAAKEAKKAERSAESEAKKAEREAAKAAKKEARQMAVAERAALVDARREDTKIAGERRAKATHVVYTGNGFSNPQTTSIRGHVLKHIKDNYEVGAQIEIAQLAKDCKPFLYGAPVRSFLSKLEERGHLDFVTVSESSDDAGENAGADAE